MKVLPALILASIVLAGCSDEDMTAACKADDLDCVARAYMVKADMLCKARIEKMAKSDLKWDEGREKPLLELYEWKDKSKGIIAYSGNKAQIQLPSGDYARESYECDIDPHNKTSPIVDIQIAVQTNQ